MPCGQARHADFTRLLKNVLERYESGQLTTFGLGHLNPFTIGQLRWVRRMLPVAGIGALLTLIAGTLITACEYRRGAAADTFLTTPRRHRVVAAKLAVGAGVGAVSGLGWFLADRGREGLRHAAATDRPTLVSAQSFRSAPPAQ
jgi:hypothetical protein